MRVAADIAFEDHRIGVEIRKFPPSEFQMEVRVDSITIQNIPCAIVRPRGELGGALASIARPLWPSQISMTRQGS